MACCSSAFRLGACSYNERETRWLILFVSITFLVAVPGDAFTAGKDRIIDMTRFEGMNIEQGVPRGWEMERFSGTPRLEVRRNRDGFCLHLYSDEESFFGVKRKMNVNLRDYPILNWRWKVNKMPRNGDVRRADRDDQVIQIYVVFSPTGFPERLNTPVVGYVWDNEAPKGWSGRSPQIGCGNVRYMVVRNKEDRLKRWHREKRNLHDDFKKLFGDRDDGTLKETVEGIAIFINSQHTRSHAESDICDIYFSRD
jgi:hypothetical protein